MRDIRLHLDARLANSALPILLASLGAIAALTVGCSKSGPAAKPAMATAVTPRPAEFSVAATQVGSAVRLDVTGFAHGHREGQPFEDPTTWSIRAHVGETELDMLVTGSTKIRRRRVGLVTQGLWDVTVAYSVSFELPADTKKLRVEVEGPDAKPFRKSVSVSGSANVSSAGT